MSGLLRAVEGAVDVSFLDDPAYSTRQSARDDLLAAYDRVHALVDEVADRYAELSRVALVPASEARGAVALERVLDQLVDAVPVRPAPVAPAPRCPRCHGSGWVERDAIVTFAEEDAPRPWRRVAGHPSGDVIVDANGRITRHAQTGVWACPTCRGEWRTP